jgi:hypothetical protein
MILHGKVAQLLTPRVQNLGGRCTGRQSRSFSIIGSAYISDDAYDDLGIHQHWFSGW